MSAEIIHISWANIFRYKGVTIDWHRYCGPIIINRHTEKERQYKNISMRIWGIVNQFSRLSDKEKEQYRIF